MSMSSNKRKNLIILRAGDQSLHPHWFDKNITRSWDLALSYFGDSTTPHPDTYEYLHLFKGSKWQGIHDFCQENADIIAEYDYIWLPDDDLLTSASNIEAFFEYCHQQQFTLAQPALLISSYISHHVTLQRFFCDYRKTNFVEIMAPCLRQDFFQRVKHSFEINSSGWGLEWLWKDIADNAAMDDFAIVDKTPIFHSRPVSNDHNGGATQSPRQEQIALSKRFGLKLIHMRSLAYFPSRFGLTRVVSTLHFMLVRLIYFSYKQKSLDR